MNFNFFLFILLPICNCQLYNRIPENYVDMRIEYFLAENKRYGIPYNSVHGPNNIKGIILPEILTVKTLLNTIKQVQE